MSKACEIKIYRTRVVSVREETQNIRSYILEGLDETLPAFEPGSHVDLLLPSGLVRQYSLISDNIAPGQMKIAVQREANGRGGSIEVHDVLAAGGEILISEPRNNFPLSDAAKRHVLIAGGIGVTPILSMIIALHKRGDDWAMHYCIRDDASAAFLSLLARPEFARRTTIYRDGGDPAKGMPIETVLAGVRRDGVHVYCCGPAGLMSRVEACVADWPSECRHFESFNAAVSANGDTPFEIEIASSGEVLTVGAQESALTALARHGHELPFVCTQGVCGTCIVDVLDGEVDHRDTVLFDDERTTKFVACCSRAKSGRLKLGL